MWWVACYDVILNKPATSDTHSLKKGRMGHLCLFVVAVITSYIVQIGASECDGKRASINLAIVNSFTSLSCEAGCSST